MKKSLVMILSVFAMFASSAGAAQDVFSCVIKKNGKQVTLSHDADRASYIYGPPGKTPELTLVMPVAKTQLEVWEGFGRVRAYSIGFPKGGYLYVVNTWSDSLDRSSGRGVRVEKGDNVLSELECDPATVRGDLEAYVIRQHELIHP